MSNISNKEKNQFLKLKTHLRIIYYAHPILPIMYVYWWYYILLTYHTIRIIFGLPSLFTFFFFPSLCNYLPLLQVLLHYCNNIPVSIALSSPPTVITITMYRCKKKLKLLLSTFLVHNHEKFKPPPLLLFEDYCVISLEREREKRENFPFVN